MPDKPEGTMTVPDEKLRGAFEAALLAKGHWPETLRREVDGTYVFAAFNDRWADWQASYAAGYQACKKEAAELAEAGKGFRNSARKYSEANKLGYDDRVAMHLVDFASSCIQAERKEFLRRLRAKDNPCLDRLAAELESEWGIKP